MKSAIVSGSTGFIGGHFVKYLIENNVRVLALGRRDFQSLSEPTKTCLRGAQYLKIEMRNIETLDLEVQRLGWETGIESAFFHLAWGGESSLSDLNVEAQLQNVVWALSALQSASRIGCSRFIQIGTMEEAFTHEYLKLDHNLHSYYNRHIVYSTAKIAAKYALEAYSLKLGIDFIYVLHSHVMGPNDDKDSFLQVTLEKLISKDPLVFSSGEQLFDVISPMDCALGYFLIGKKGVPGTDYWVGSGTPKPLREYIQRMYSLYPSGQQMRFGELSYNDVILDAKVFSIDRLVADTGYMPSMTYEQTVVELYHSLTVKHGDLDVRN